MCPLRRTAIACNTSTGAHCERNAWCSAGHCGKPAGGPFWCSMHWGYPPGEAQRQAKDDVDRFCLEELLLGDPTCPEPSPGQPLSGAVRTTGDPK